MDQAKLARMQASVRIVRGTGRLSRRICDTRHGRVCKSPKLQRPDASRDMKSWEASEIGITLNFLDNVT
ncbi:hypothetical protein BDV30DRAFT_215664 [Aspergillus minisclerotigenes]|uniref:Uncharacterized protein n=1 Tax=Aspergillus minisclerotigenes TaxID=656917 RepID=A0A5N6IV21_9EURO|nr:hypothetical protein BDV30DRAFT_215664 [Aspergillus minisclerotigenes]